MSNEATLLAAIPRAANSATASWSHGELRKVTATLLAVLLQRGVPGAIQFE